MKVQLATEDLKNCLAYAHKLVARTKAAIAAGIGIQFLFKDKTLRLYCSNGVQICEITFGAIDCSDFNCVLEFAVLYKVISLSDSDILDLSFEDNSLSLVSGKNEYDLVYLTEKDYSLWIKGEQLENIFITEIPIAELKKAQSFLAVCLPSATAFSHFKGINFDGNLVATNTHGFAYYALNLVVEEPLFISLESFSLLAGMEQSDDKVMLYKNGNSITASVGKARYLVSLMATSFPKYDKVIQRLKKHTHTVHIPRDTFAKACKKLSLFTDSYRKNSAHITITPGEMALAVSSETKKGKEVISVETGDILNEISFFVNLVDIRDYAAQVSGNTIELTFNDTIDDYAIRDGGAWYIDRTLTS